MITLDVPKDVMNESHQVVLRRVKRGCELSRPAAQYSVGGGVHLRRRLVVHYWLALSLP